MDEQSRAQYELLASSRIAADFYGPSLVGHKLCINRETGTFENLIYARQGIALGKGQFGQVHLEYAQNESAYAPGARAVKEINKDFCRSHNVQWEREVEALTLLSRSEHRELFISFFGWYESPDTIFLATEYFPLGDLSKHVQFICEESAVVEIAGQLTAGLAVMHKHSIIHRDLNPRNIFVTTTGPTWRTKIADFGSSKHLHENTGLWTTTGTSGYMAPEYSDFMRDSSEYAEPTSAVDMWSLGCIIYELYTKQKFFHEQHKALKAYCRDPVLPDTLKTSFASIAAQSVLDRFLDPVAETRITADEAQSLLWLSDHVRREDEIASPVKFEHDEPEPVLAIKAIPEEPTASPVPLHSMMSTLSLASTATLVEHESRPPLPSRPRTFPTTAPLATSSLPEPNRPGLPVRTPKMSVSSAASMRTMSYSSSITGSEQTDVPGPETPMDPLDDQRLSLQLTNTSVTTFSEPNYDMSLQKVYSPENEEILRPDIGSVSPWFRSHYVHQELSMSFGPLPFQMDTTASCDNCNILYASPASGRAPTTTNVLYLCESCGRDRILCERCARQVINRPDDPHEAEHALRRVGPAHTSYFTRFLQDNMLIPEIYEGVPQSFGATWLGSDHAFESPTPNCRAVTTTFTLFPPEGIHQIAVYLQIAFYPERVSSDGMGTYRKKAMKMTKTAYGSVAVGAETNSVAEIAAGSPTAKRYLPSNRAFKDVFHESNRNEFGLHVPLPSPIEVGSGQKLEITVRSSYDNMAFKDGCPFKWYLNYIGLSQFGNKMQIASKGQLLKRDQVIEKQQALQKKIQNERKWDYAMKATTLGARVVGIGGAVQGYAANRAQKRHHAMAELESGIGVLTRLNTPSNYGGSEYMHGDNGAHYGNGQNWDNASAVGVNTSSDLTQQWVSGQEVPDAQPFVATFESVQYNAGTGGTSATYTYVGGATY